MLLAIRDKAHGWIAWVIVILISIPFALWGIQEYLGVGGDPVVVEVDGVEITQNEIDASMQRYRSALRERLGAAYNPDMFPDRLVREQVLRSMIRDVVLAQTATGLGLRAGDEMVRAQILDVPAFQRAGSFDPAAYKSAISMQGYTPAAFEARLRDDLATSILESGIRSGAVVTDVEVDDFVRLRDQKRDIAYVTVEAAGFLGDSDPADEEIQAFYDQNSSRFMQPERVRIAYIELNRDQLADAVVVDEEALQAYYDRHQAEYGAPEQRRVRHILIQVDGEGEEADSAARTKAEEVLGKLRNGEEFAALAEAHSADPGSAAKGGDLGVIERGAMVEAFEEAAFALDENALGEPVKTDFGYHIIQVTEILAAHVQTLDEVRDRVSSGLRQEEADRQFYDLAERLTDLVYESPDSLEPAAEALGLEVVESDWITREGAAGGALASPKVASAAFSEDVLARGYNSDLIEIDPSHYVALRSLAHEEAAARPLAEVREEIVESLRQQAAAGAAEELASRILDEVKGGAALEAAAQSGELALEERAGVARRGDDLPPPLVDAAFAAGRPVGDSPLGGQVVLPGGDRVVFVVRGVSDADPSALSAEEREAVRNQLAARRSEQEFAVFMAQQEAEADIRVELTNEE